MRVMILAAGLGTRLRPLTNTKPKALVEVGGRPMLEYSLDWFEKFGFREAVINIHHFPDQMRAYIEACQKRRKIKLFIQDESKELLGSGGAIASAREWLYETNAAALIWNPDGLIFPNLLDFVEFHEKAVRKGKLATMNLLRHPDVGTRYHPVYYRDGDVIGFGRQNQLLMAEAFHFAGAYILDKTAAAFLPPPGTVCDVAKEVWFPLVGQSRFAGYIYEGPYQDLGTPEDILTANRRIQEGAFRDYLFRA